LLIEKKKKLPFQSGAKGLKWKVTIIETRATAALRNALPPESIGSEKLRGE
jgi:hypothetical protein